jgi:hypothetical protein
VWAAVCEVRGVKQLIRTKGTCLQCTRKKSANGCLKRGRRTEKTGTLPVRHTRARVQERKKAKTGLTRVRRRRRNEHAFAKGVAGVIKPSTMGVLKAKFRD